MLKEHARDILLKQAFGIDTKGPKTPQPPGTEPLQGGTTAPAPFHQLVERWTPTTQAEWALLGAYYFQEVLGNQNVTAFQVNKELKQHGTPIANITVSLEENISQNPALIRQIAKSGKTKQAKKKYVVTTNGINFVKDKLNAQKQA